MLSRLSRAGSRLLVVGGHVMNRSRSVLLWKPLAHKQLPACCYSTESPHIKLSTSKALIDEKVKITVHGLAQGQEVTLQTCMEEGGKLYGACGHYIADTRGKVDTFTDSSYGGTFEGVEPMGLFWSMKTTPGMKPGRLIKANVMVPYDVTVAVQNGFWKFEDLPWSTEIDGLTSCHLQRTHVTEGVKRIPVSENGLYGTLFLPPGEGPFPTVIDIFGITGGIIEFRSSLLASHGFASFAIAYVDHEDLPKDQTMIDLNYFLKAFDWLASHPQVDRDALGGVSTCIGGGYLQLIASLRPAMKCMASVNSTGVPSAPEQTVEGHHMKPLVFHAERYKLVEDMISFHDLFLPDDDFTICPGWQHGAKLLSIHALDDMCINPSFIEVFKSHIPPEFRDNCTFISYPGAGHLLEPPYSPLCRYNFSQIAKCYLLWGGKPKAHADAAKDSWPRILAFLEENLGRSGSVRTSHPQQQTSKELV